MELPPGKDLEHPSDVFVVLGSLSVDDGQGQLVVFLNPVAVRLSMLKHGFSKNNDCAPLYDPPYCFQWCSPHIMS